MASDVTITECHHRDLRFSEDLDALDGGQVFGDVLGGLYDLLGALDVPLASVVDERRPAGSGDPSGLGSA